MNYKRKILFPFCTLKEWHREFSFEGRRQGSKNEIWKLDISIFKLSREKSCFLAFLKAPWTNFQVQPFLLKYLCLTHKQHNGAQQKAVLDACVLVNFRLTLDYDFVPHLSFFSQSVLVLSFSSTLNIFWKQDFL